jgi:Flp pilus assembly protein TadB
MPPKTRVRQASHEFQQASEQYLRLQLEHWELYHHHKEQMAFAATGLYLTGAAALAFAGRPLVIRPLILGWLALFLLVSLTVVLGFVFVLWQYLHRNTAASYVRAYGALLLSLLERPSHMTT